jgi:hypothetical protein
MAFMTVAIIPGYVNNAQKPSFRANYNTAAGPEQTELVLYEQ